MIVTGAKIKTQSSRPTRIRSAGCPAQETRSGRLTPTRSRLACPGSSEQDERKIKNALVRAYVRFPPNRRRLRSTLKLPGCNASASRTWLLSRTARAGTLSAPTYSATPSTRSACGSLIGVAPAEAPESNARNSAITVSSAFSAIVASFRTVVDRAEPAP